MVMDVGTSFGDCLFGELVGIEFLAQEFFGVLPVVFFLVVLESSVATMMVVVGAWAS